MSTADDYADRLHDLLEDMSSDGIDQWDVIFNLMLDYLEATTFADDDKAVCVDIGNKTILIRLIEGGVPEEATAARLH
ncbi:hypothetical protein EHJ06_21370 [Cronobacter malonaticus]|uniref:hypothetical protein n=1 Tax=Cronobacter malonaticus TaxID=413503 RepID=UPI001375D4B0|nr:hypothetical protein [Cronobacter malonaticus]NCH03875.1 hypothetical protein [Cronobacter malonaticus]